MTTPPVDQGGAAALLGQALQIVATDPTGARGLAREALGLAGPGDLRTQALAHRMQGHSYRAEGRHADALPHFEQATALALRTSDPLLVASVQLGYVDSLGMVGRTSDALGIARGMVLSLRAANAPADLARALVNLGGLHFRSDSYAEALECYAEASVLLAEVSDDRGLARALANQANALMQMGQADEALALNLRARTSFEDAGLMFEAGVVDNNIGYSYHVSGRHAQALAAFARAEAAFVGAGRAQEGARCSVDAAETYCALNLFPEALEHDERALAVFGRLPLEYDRGRAELGRAVALLAQGMMTEARTALETAGSIFETLGNRVQSAHVQLVLAQLLWAEEDVEGAQQAALRSATVMARAGLAGWAAEARFIALLVDVPAGRCGMRPVRDVARVARLHGRGWLEARAEGLIGRTYAQQGRVGLALKHLRRAAEALESARTLIAPEGMHIAFMRDKQAPYEEIVGVLVSRGRPADILEALGYVERAKSRLLLERVQSAISGRESEGLRLPLETVGRLADLRAELSRLYQQAHSMGATDTERLGGDPASGFNRLAHVERSYHAALRDAELAARAGGDGLRFPGLVSPSELQAALGADEALVEFCVVDGRFCAFVVTRDRVRLHTGLALESDVSAAARRMRYQLHRIHLSSVYGETASDHLQSGAVGALQSLYDLVLRPVADALNCKRVVLVPHGILHSLPFHAFHDGSGYVLDRWELIYAPSAALWHAGLTRPASDRRESAPSLVMGVPASGIEHVADEVARAAAALPRARALLGDEATLGAFGALAGGNHVLHIASHAQFREDNPLFSGLALSDGWLLARDLYEMTLDCDLATLSACQTGLAAVEPGDELLGLVRGFLASGARSVAASLWPTHDGSTADTMSRFYALCGEGHSYAAALREAQRGTREVFPHPYHWAAFALFGRR